MQHCSHCQATLGPDVQFCSNCGADVPFGAASVNSAPPEANQHTSARTELPTAASTVADYPFPRVENPRMSQQPPDAGASGKKPGRSSWKKRVAVAVGVAVPAILLVGFLSGLGLVSGARAAALVAADLKRSGTRTLRVWCPNQVLSKERTLTCEVKDPGTGNVLGTAEVIRHADGSLAVSSYSTALASEFDLSPDAPTASAPPTPSPKERMRDENADARWQVSMLKRGHPKHTFGRFQRARKPWHTPWIVSVSGKRSHLWRWDDADYKWRNESTLLNMRDLPFERIRNVDVTGDGRVDFLLKGTDPTSGFPYTALVINRGNDAKAATFKEGDGRYGAVAFLEWTGSELISDYGRWNRISIPGGYTRTRWDRKGKTLVWIERPA